MVSLSHREFIVIRSSIDSHQDLIPTITPQNDVPVRSAHRIVTSRWLGQGNITDRHLVPPPFHHLIQ